MLYVPALTQAYKEFIALQWRTGSSGAEKCLFLIYPPSEERRVRGQLAGFDAATTEGHHNWIVCELTDAFPEWMAAHEYAQSYFEEPELLESALDGFLEHTADLLLAVLDSPEADENSVVAVCGIASLFGLIRNSSLITKVEGHIRGRLAVFFPGEYHDAQYALLGVKHGWNYHAVPIKPSEMTLSC